MATPRCIHGHLLTDDNFYVSDKGRKACRRCAADAAKRWRAKNRARCNEYNRAYRARRKKRK